jgi:hypothetical protein
LPIAIEPRDKREVEASTLLAVASCFDASRLSAFAARARRWIFAATASKAPPRATLSRLRDRRNAAD